MTLDEHTPCPACPQIVRDLYVTARRVLEHEPAMSALIDHEELHRSCEAVRPWVEAHHANQLHAFSLELEAARDPKLTAIPADHDGSPR